MLKKFIFIKTNQLSKFLKSKLSHGILAVVTIIKTNSSDKDIMYKLIFLILFTILFLPDYQLTLAKSI